MPATSPSARGRPLRAVLLAAIGLAGREQAHGGMQSPKPGDGNSPQDAIRRDQRVAGSYGAPGAAISR